MRRPGLTIRQAEVLSVVRDWIAQHGYSPTSVELAPVLGITISGVTHALMVLRDKRCLVRGGQSGVCSSKRTLRLTDPAPGPVCVHLASAVVAHENGKPAGVAYRITSVETRGAP